MLAFVFVFLCTLVHLSCALPLSSFYSYGSSAEDTKLPPTDEDKFYVALSSHFSFFDGEYTELYINSNGIISFLRPLTWFYGENFPRCAMPVIAPYWGDVNTLLKGAIWYGERNNNQSQMNQVKAQVKSFFPSHQSFEPNLTFVVTWDEAPSYYQSYLMNTFQCILTSNGTQSFAIFFFADGLMEWVGYYAKAVVGYDAGDGIWFDLVQGSGTSNIITSLFSSNVGISGVWAFDLTSKDITGRVFSSNCPTAPYLSVYLTPNTSSNIVPLHSAVEIVCKAVVGTIPLTFMWQSPHGTSQTTTSNTNQTSSSFAVFTNNSYAYGIYTCTVNNSRGSHQEFIEIEMEVLPDLSTQLISSAGSIVPYGSMVKLVCIVHDGTLPISVAWQSPNGSTTTSTLTSHSSWNISITPTTNSHYGTYTCTAINIYGNDTGTLILVEPEVLPDLSTELISSDGNIVPYRSTVKLVCIVYAGTFPINVTWQSPDGSLVSATTTNSTESNIFVTPTTSSDYGTYLCTASNGAGNDTATIDLLEPQVRPDLSTELISSDGNTVPYGSTVKLVCRVYAGTLPINVTWLSPEGSTTTSILTSHTSWNISITLTTSLHYGAYICTAYNNIGSDNDTLKLTEPQNSFFQILFKTSDSCTSWKSGNQDEKIKEEIKKNLMKYCQCDIKIDDVVSNGELLCSDEESQLITYQARVHGTEKIAAHEIISYIEQWLSSDMSLNIAGQQLQVLSFCSVPRYSDKITCGSMTNGSVAAQSKISTSIIGIIIAASSAAVIFLIVFVVICAFKLKIKKGKAEEMNILVSDNDAEKTTTSEKHECFEIPQEKTEVNDDKFIEHDRSINTTEATECLEDFQKETAINKGYAQDVETHKI